MYMKIPRNFPKFTQNCIKITNKYLNLFHKSLKAGSTRCVARIRGASCGKCLKRFVESDTYSLLWCVNLPPNWRTRCDEWTNDTFTQIRFIFSYTKCANHDAWHVTNTNHTWCGPSLTFLQTFFISLKYLSSSIGHCKFKKKSYSAKFFSEIYLKLLQNH